MPWRAPTLLLVLTAAQASAGSQAALAASAPVAVGSPSEPAPAARAAGDGATGAAALGPWAPAVAAPPATQVTEEPGAGGQVPAARRDGTGEATAAGASPRRARATPGVSPYMVEETGVTPAAPRRFGRCSPGMTPCVRSHPARMALGISGLLVAAVGAGWLVLADDTVGGGSPGTLIGSGGAMMLGGALLGGLAALIDGDRRSSPDRVRPETLGLTYGFAQGAVLGEAHPGTMHARWAPSWYFPNDRGRLRFGGYAGGLLGREVNVDPRQPVGVFPAGPGTTRTSFGFGLDLALALPYPARRTSRARWLGPVELRWRPEVHVRRDLYGADSDAPLLAARTMLLPLTLGVRWHLSARQRFTAYAGPRLDFIAFSETGGPPLRRGPPQIGSFFGEFWYDIDIPLTPARVDRRGRPWRASVQSQLSVGYVHSRFGAPGVNIGKVIGYLGVVGAAYRVRVRPRGAAYALQIGAVASVGATLGGVLEFGVVLPDLGLRRDGTEERRAI